MKATLITDYMCAPEGHTVFKFKAGTIVESPIAEMAIADGAAIVEPTYSQADPLERKITLPAETKRKRGRPRKDESE